MITPADVLSEIIGVLTEEKSLSRRRTHANAAYAALRQLREAQPPANAAEAEQRGYEQGALKALEVAHEVRREFEESFKPARYTAAGNVLNGVENYGQSMLSKAESAVTRHLNERRRKETT
jgi:hypothetical protein